MEVAKLILDFTLKALDGVNVIEAKTTLKNAKKLINTIYDEYYLECALRALFKEETEVAE